MVSRENFGSVRPSLGNRQARVLMLTGIELCTKNLLVGGVSDADLAHILAAQAPVVCQQYIVRCAHTLSVTRVTSPAPKNRPPQHVGSETPIRFLFRPNELRFLAFRVSKNPFV